MRRMTVLVVVAALTLSACGKAAETAVEKAAEQATEQALESDAAGDGGDVDVDLGTDSEGINISGTDAETGENVQIQMGGSEIPADFPMPLPDTGEVVNVSFLTMDDVTAYEVRLQIDPKDWKAIREFYTQWMDDQGMDLLASDEAVFGSTDDGAVASVAYDDYGDYGEVRVGWTP